MARESDATTKKLDFNAMVTAMPFTVSFFFKFNSLTQAATAFRLNNSAVTNYYYVAPRGDVAGDPLEANQQTGGSGFISRPSGAYSSTAWNHAAAVFSSNNSNTSYLNGTASTTNSGTANTPSSIVSGVFISPNVSSTTLTGSELGVWSVALTAAEVASLNKGFSPRRIRPQSLVFYAPFVRDLIDMRGALAITDNSTAVADHSRVY